MASIILTRHAYDRFTERTNGTKEDLQKIIRDATISHNIPTWVVLGQRDRDLTLYGVVTGHAWQDHPRRKGWERRVKVCIPIVRHKGKYIAVTAVTKKTATERLKDQG